MEYVELQVTSNYSFLRGASHVEELFAQAKAYGYSALALTDHGTLAGMARAHVRAKEAGIRLIVGCRLDLECGSAVLVYPKDRAAYGRLCTLLSLGRARGGKSACILGWEDVRRAAEGMVGVLLPGPADARTQAQLRELRACFGRDAYLALTVRRQPGAAMRLHDLANMAAGAGVRCVATGDVLYHEPSRRMLQDVLSCIREGCRIEAAGFRRARHGERHLQTPKDMQRLFARFPEALANAGVIADLCRFSLDELRYQYPRETGPGESAQEKLERLTWEGAKKRWGDAISPQMAAQLRHELGLIGQLEYAPYFLTVHSIVQFARSRRILCQGRGSAANSAVCFALEITAIDPVRSNLLFERFISAERREPPDIDVDFEHDRREEVIQWIFERYGRDRAALCATVTRYRARGAVRDVGKAMGLPEDITAALASQVWGWSEDGGESAHAAELNMNLEDRRLRLTLELARSLIGFPRHLSQHPGGFVLTEEPLCELVPVQPAAMAERQVIEWDKDDIDNLRFMKVDVLGLGMLGCLRRAFELLEAHRGIALDMAKVPQEDAPTYAMIQRADTVGVFQIESRAQMSMLPRIKPRTFYDLVIEVAIVRPGPIQGDMVHPYLRRREGLEPVDLPTEELRGVLGKTLGVPLFQEQAMKVAIVCAGFTPTEADALRRAMATFKMTGGVHHFRDKLISGMCARGYSREFAERTITQIEGFGSYGFPESHAASFAMITYVSCWLKCHHPDVFACALLNAQPMGFYAPAQIVRDAKAHGVPVLPVCVNRSRWDCTLEPQPGSNYLAIRLGLRMVAGLANGDAAALVFARQAQDFTSIDEMRRRTGLGVGALERLAEADGFAGLGKDRRGALWDIKALARDDLPLFAHGGEVVAEAEVALTPMREGGEVVADYRSLGLSLKAHPVGFLRGELAAKGVVVAEQLAGLRDGARVRLAGLVLVRQRPGSAKGVMFITIEDETGHANLIIWPDLFERRRRLIMQASLLFCLGRLQREGEVTHVIMQELEDYSQLLLSVAGRGGFAMPAGRGDEARHPVGADHRTLRVKPRNFR